MDEIKFTVKFFSENDSNNKMEPMCVTYGSPVRLRKNVYKRKGHDFVGWKAYRMSDSKICCIGQEKKRRFFSEKKLPENYQPYYYKDMAYISKLSRVDNDTIIMYPQWKLRNTSDENKKILEARILSRPVVLLGGYEECKRFYDKYADRLNFRCILLENEETDIASVNDIPVYQFDKSRIIPNDFVIICRQVKIRLDNLYRDAKKSVVQVGLTMMKDFIRADIAELVLDGKKLWLWFGYCQLNTLCNDIFSNLKPVAENWVIANFRYELDTIPKSYKYDETKELLSLCDCLTYIPLFAANGKMNFEFDDYLASNAKEVRIPRLPFGGYYPWRDKDSENFFKYTLDNKLHWPFAYQEKIIDDLIEAGYNDDEIYSKLMQEDLYSEKEVQRKLKTSYKLIEISEKTSDIKILDYMKENLQERMLYRDGLHYQNFMYFELARRIAAFIGLDCADEINSFEKQVEQSGKQYIDYTEVPVLPCVAKALDLKFIDDNTMYRVKFTQNGAWRGTKTTIKLMNRKDWIYTYIRYVRSVMTLKEMWML